MKIALKSLGCPKNLIDTETLCGILQRKNQIISLDTEEADVLIINTCSFIREAVEESREEIFKSIQLKREGRIRRLVVAGCLPQRYIGSNLREEFPEVDAFLGVGDLLQIEKVIDKIFKNNQKVDFLSETPNFLYNNTIPRLILTPSHYTYIKIADGCENNCSYCLIPKIRGKYRSRKIEDIVEEVELISQKQKVHEIILIAQDTTRYGVDLYGDYKLTDLLKRLSLLPSKDLKWIRLLYTHPAHYTPELISIMGEYPRIVPYLDLPLQHINDDILHQMNRRTTKAEIISLIKRLRKQIPALTLRTTFIVGFPGEDEHKFEELIEFVKENRFEKLGAFVFSPEEGTPAYNFSQQVSRRKKKERLERLMLVQQEISREINQSFLGKELEVLVDEEIENKTRLVLGRSVADAPEIDGKVNIKTDQAKRGDMIKVKITSALEYDLIGELVKDKN